MMPPRNDQPPTQPGAEGLGICSPSDTIRIYEGVIMELGNYLHNVYAVAGGLVALPLSDSAKSVLGLSVASPPDKKCTVAASDGLPMPHSPRSAAAAPLKSRSASQPTTAHPQPVPRNASAGAMDARHLSLHKLAGSALAREELANTSYGQLVMLTGELQRTVAEQQADIADLEEALRESKMIVRTLRSQAKEKELRQYAAAADAVGLRRTESIMPAPGTLLSGQPGAPAIGANSMTADLPVAAQGSWRMSRFRSAGSLASPPRHGTMGSLTEAGRRPSGYVNGWPVYDSDGARDGVLVASPDTAARRPLLAADSPLSSSPQSGPATLLHRASIESALGVSSARGAGSLMPKPRLLRTMVARGSRRVFSKVSGQLKWTKD
ncbi:hypothetical protein H4R19_001658 [Coemansia spiralis]|nr:hypothetical protein H4R19_001658 [Coemansia spiralis]